ncbi:MAG TPA: hypothetical protein EYQ42_11690 [Thiotrichaceae bacterium]|jgi:hypothetical protein|nr:hypothetical protein [Thiotrichaceae bacterium]HIM07003.1 hypothetical protein [Gammaproteobacteria bacterium]
MDNAELEEHIKMLSDSELAQQISEDLEQYKNVMMESDTTMSIPNLNRICMMADELSKRLSSTS